MRRIVLALVAAGAAGVAVSLPAAPARQAVAARDWTRTVSATVEGGFRMGNPNAPVKLVEYGSLTCGVCARFAAEGMPQLLSDYVKGGRVSFEFRNYVRDPYDLTGALLSRCAAPAAFFGLTHEYFATQREWIGRVQPQVAAISALPPSQRFGRVASVAGLDAMAAKAGVSPAKARQCLNDPKGLAKLVAMRKVADETFKVSGTPAFILNGSTVQASNWATLRPLLGPPAG